MKMKRLPPELKTVRALRLDLALKIARHAKSAGGSQVEVARSLGIPQPTLSKIVRGRVADLSLDLLIRIATRAKLQLVLLISKDPAEAGVFASGRALARRA